MAERMKFSHDPDRLTKRVRTAFDRAIDDTLTEAKRIAPSRTGKFKRSLARTPVTEADGVLTATIGSPLASARIKEEGGTIRARVADWLAIPNQDGGIRLVKQVTIRATPVVKKAGPKFGTFMTRRLKEGRR